MEVTEQELQDFNRFALKQLANGGVESISKLASEWDEYRQSIADLLESHADAEAGRIRPADEVFADIRKKLGIDE